MSADATPLSSQRDALAAWLTLTAPGALVTCAVIALAVLLTPVVAPMVLVTRAARHTAAALLAIHAAVTVLLLLKPGRWAIAALFLLVLALDALLCGGLCAAHWHGPGPLLAVAVLVISLEAGGWLAAGLSLVAAALGAALATVLGVDAAVFMPVAMSFPTTLAVETSFAGTVAAPALSFPTTLSVETSVAAPHALEFPTVLSVETWMGGTPAFASWNELLIPTLAVTFLALCLGLTTSLWRVRRARSAVAASIVAAARVAP